MDKIETLYGCDWGNSFAKWMITLLYVKSENFVNDTFNKYCIIIPAKFQSRSLTYRTRNVYNLEHGIFRMYSYTKVCDSLYLFYFIILLYYYPYGPARDFPIRREHIFKTATKSKVYPHKKKLQKTNFWEIYLIWSKKSVVKKCGHAQINYWWSYEDDTQSRILMQEPPWKRDLSIITSKIGCIHI